VPGPVAGGIAFSELAAGASHTCGLGLNGVAYCWGENSEGQLGDGTIGGARSVPAPVAAANRFFQLTAGVLHNCGVAKNSRILCWGSNRVGQLGGGTTVERRAQPTRVAGNHLFTNVGGKASHTCGITVERRTYCWGDNSYGALGHGTTGEVRYAPVIVVGDFKFRAVDGGAWHTCALTGSSKLRCWGGNEFGQLGNGTTRDRSTPGSAIQGLVFDQMTTGGLHTCGLTVFEGQAYCWGSNSAGQLGDGTTTTRLTPTPVAGPS
jgi:alpha-tubulin suppressor-like RCC1 family protein